MKLGFTFIHYLQTKKYEFLLFGLMQHAFIALILPNLKFYTHVIWPINMVVLVISCASVFVEKSRIRKKFIRLLSGIICFLPILASFITYNLSYMVFLSVTYTLFFILVFYEVIKFLIRPSYINTDIISACFCGYLLLIEMFTFLMQTIFYLNPNAFKGLSLYDPAATYIDFVYYATITITSIGFGDILPNIYQTKLLTSIFGIIGQFYSVVLVGIIISKFSSRNIDKQS